MSGYVTRPRAFLLMHEHDLGAERSHHLGALRRVALGHHRHERMTGHRAHDRQPRPRVAARELHDRLAGPQVTAPLGVLDHRGKHPVLLRAARVQVVELGEHPAVETAGDAPQLDEGRVPDRGENGGARLPKVSPPPRSPDIARSLSSVGTSERPIHRAGSSRPRHTLARMQRRTVGRGLGAVLFTDIVGSTGIAAEIGNTRWSELVTRHHRLVRGSCGASADASRTRRATGSSRRSSVRWTRSGVRSRPRRS